MASPASATNPIDDVRLYIDNNEWMLAMQEVAKVREPNGKKNERYFPIKGNELFYEDIYLIMKKIFENLEKAQKDIPSIKMPQNKSQKVRQWCKYVVQSRNTCSNLTDIEMIADESCRNWLLKYFESTPDKGCYYFLPQRDIVRKIVSDIQVTIKKKALMPTTNDFIR